MVFIQAWQHLCKIIPKWDNFLGILTGRGNHEAENFDRVGAGWQLLAAFAAGLHIRLADVPSMFVGSVMLRAVWECYAGVMLAESDQETSPCFKGVDETNYGDVMQNWRGLNGLSLGDYDL